MKKGYLSTDTNSRNEQWLSTTSRVLYERPERLQKTVLDISKGNPEMGYYASDVAKLRMSGLVMENILFGIWNADSAGYVDQLLKQQPTPYIQCSPALSFLAELIKTDLNRKQRLHPTMH
jgi:hypothetical protein